MLNFPICFLFIFQIYSTPPTKQLDFQNEAFNYPDASLQNSGTFLSKNITPVFNYDKNVTYDSSIRNHEQRILSNQDILYYFDIVESTKLDPEHSSSDNISNWQNGLARLSDGNIIVVWQSNQTINTGNSKVELYGEILNGTTLSPYSDPFLISSGQASGASVDAFSSGGFVVVWQTQNLSNYIVSCSFFYDNMGKNRSSEFIINSNTLNSNYQPQVKTLNYPMYIVVWTCDKMSPNTIFSGICGKVMSNTGPKSSSTDKLLNNPVNYIHQSPKLAILSNGVIAITWFGDHADAERYGVLANFFTKDLVPLTSQFIVNTNMVSWQSFPTITSLDPERIVISWMSWNRSLSCNQLKAKIFNYSLTSNSYNIIANEFFITEDSVQIDDIFYQIHSIVSLKTQVQGFLVAYTNSIGNIQNFGFYFKVFDNYGNQIRSQYQYVSEKLTPEVYPPYAIELLDGSIAVIWSPFIENDNTFTEIFAVQFTIKMLEGSIININNFTIKQGETLKLTAENLDSEIREDFYVKISSLSHCFFEIDKNSGIYTKLFTLDQIAQEAIYLIHDGGTYAPTFTMLIQSFTYKTISKIIQANIVFQAYSISSSIFISQNNINGSFASESLLTPENLGLKCISCDLNNLWIHIIFSLNGYFALSSDISTPLKKFNYFQLKNSLINFICDKSNLKPIYQIVASDGNSATLPQNCYVNFPEEDSQPFLMAEFRISNDTVWDHANPHIATKSTGDYAIVWEADGKDGSGAGIFMQIVDKSNNKIGPETQINTANNWYSTQSDPKVKYDQQDNLIIIFTDSIQGLMWIKIIFSSNQNEYQSPLFWDYFTTGNGFHSIDYPDFDTNIINHLTLVYEAPLYDDQSSLIRVQIQYLSFIITSNSLLNSTNYVGSQPVYLNESVSQEKPEIILLDNDDFVVVWQQKDISNTIGYDVYIKFPSLPPKQVNQYNDSDQNYPKIASLFDGGFVVIWQSYGQDGDQFGIFGRKYFENGTEHGDEFQINSFFSGNQKTPAITQANTGHFIVTWSSQNQDGSLDGIFAQKFDVFFLRIGYEFQVNTYVIHNQIRPAAAMGLNDCFMIVWQSFQQDAMGINSIYGLQFCASMTYTKMIMQNTEFSISQPAILPFNVDNLKLGIASSSDGEFLIVWPEKDQQISKANFHIYAQYNDKFGQKRGEDFIVSLRNPTDQTTMSFFPAVGMAGDNSFAVVWDGIGLDYESNDHDIYAQCFDSSGIPINVNFSIKASSSIFRVNSMIEGYQYYPRMAMNNRGQFVIVWASKYEGAMLGQLLGPNCTKIGHNFRIAQTPSRNWAYLNVDILETGDFIVVWRHNLGDFDQSWAVRYHSSGKPIGEIFEISPIWHGKGPDIKFLNDNKYVISITTYDRDKYFHGIFEQIYFEDGTLAALDSQVNTYFLHDQTFSGIGALSDGSYFIIWQSDGPDGDGDGIRGQYFSSNGMKLDEEISINTDVYGDQSFSAIGVSSEDDILVVWDSRQEAIQAQRFRMVMGITKASKDSLSPILAIEVLKETYEIVPVDITFSEDEIYVYAIDSTGNLQIYDRKRDNDHLSPTLLYNKNLTNEQICCMVKNKNFLYIANIDTSLFIIKIDDTNQWNLTQAMNISIEKYTKSLFLDSDNSLLYIASSKNGLQIYDVSNASFPKMQAKISNVTNINKVCVFDDIIVIIHESSHNFTVMNLTVKSIYSVSLGSYAYTCVINNDGNLVLLGTSHGLKIFDLKTKFIISSIEMQSVFSIKFSRDYTLLSICSEKYHLLYDSNDISKNLFLIKNTTFASILLFSHITMDNDNIILFSEALYLVKIVRPILDDIIPTLTPLGKLNLNQNFSNSLAMTIDEKYVFISDYYNLIYKVDIGSLNASSFVIKKTFSGFTNVIHMITSENYLYIINSTGLFCWQINELELILIKTYQFNDPIDLIASNDENYLYLVNNSEIHEINKITFQLANKIPINFVYQGNPSRLAISSNRSFLALACKSDGFLVYDFHSTKIYPVYLGVEIYDVKFSESENQLLLIVVGGSGVKIFQLINTATNNMLEINLLSETYVAENTNGLEICKGKFIVVQSEIIIYLIQISNPKSPILLEYKTSHYANLGYRLAITKDFQYLIMPTLEVIGFYSSDTSIYPFMKMINFDNNKKEFLINFYGVSVKTGNSIVGYYKMLRIEIQPNAPSWVTIDVENGCIYLFPASLQDLISFTKLIIIVSLSKQIDSRIFFADEMTNLKLLGVVDMDNYPTDRFDVNSNFLTNNQKNTLQKHFLNQKIVFPLTSFLELNKPPEIYRNISSQFVEIYKNYSIIIGKRFDFTFSETTFIDPDQDLITYTVEINGTIDSWISFDTQSRRFTGTPTKFEKNSNVSIIITGNDGYASTIDNLNFKVIKIPPRIIKIADKHSLSNIYNVIGDFLFILPVEITDVDGDSLVYQVIFFDFDQNKSISTPGFMTFDNTKLEFKGTIDYQKYSFPKVNSYLYYKKYLVELTVIDIADDTILSEFELIFQNYAPTLKDNNTLQEQFLRKAQHDLNSNNLQVEISLELDLEKDTFLDNNTNSSLSYGATVNGKLLPDWIKFDSVNFKLYFYPGETELNNNYIIIITAFNGVQSLSSSFEFQVVASWIYILKLLAKIIGPILGVLGFFKKRSSFYALFCKKRYTFKKIKIHTNETFVKDFYLIEEHLRNAHFLYEELIKDKEFIKKESLTEFLLNNKNDQELCKMLKAAKHDVSRRKNAFFINLEKEHLEINGTVFIIVKSFLLELNFHNYPYLKRIYNQMRLRLMEEYDKNWYEPFISIVDNKRNLKHELFPLVNVDENLVKKQMEIAEKIFLRKTLLMLCFQTCCCLKKKKIDEDQFKIISGMIVNDALGIKNLEYQCFHLFEGAKGESILIPVKNLEQIKCKRLQIMLPGFIAKILKTLNLDKFDIETSANKKLPCWLDFEITLGVLRFTGEPTDLDIGSTIIQIISKSGYIVKEFEIVVQEKKDEMKQSKFLGRQKTSLRNTLIEKRNEDLEFFNTKNTLEDKDINKFMKVSVKDSFTNPTSPTIVPLIKKNDKEDEDEEDFNKNIFDEEINKNSIK